jgi:hypothetical protein
VHAEDRAAPDGAPDSLQDLSDAPPDSPEAPPVRAPTVRTQRPADVAGAPVGPVLRRRRPFRKKQPSAEAVCVRWSKVPLHEASVLQTDLKIE